MSDVRSLNQAKDNIVYTFLKYCKRFFQFHPLAPRVSKALIIEQGRRFYKKHTIVLLSMTSSVNESVPDTSNNGLDSCLPSIMKLVYVNSILDSATSEK